MFKKLAQQLKAEKNKNNFQSTSLPIEKEFTMPKNEFLKNISKKALELYEKQKDIGNFKKLVLSNPENKNHNELVKQLFNEGVIDPFVDEKLEALSNNNQFLKDLGLM